MRRRRHPRHSAKWRSALVPISREWSKRPHGEYGLAPELRQSNRQWMQDFQQVFVTPREGMINSSRLSIYGVAQNGDLLWYSYNGNGENNRSGSIGWAANSGNAIGNGWEGFRRIFACGGVIFGVQPNGDLLWYSYVGNGESDRSGSTGWSPNSGNPIGNGWQNFGALFGGSDDSGGFGQVIFAVAQNAATCSGTDITDTARTTAQGAPAGAQTPATRLATIGRGEAQIGPRSSAKHDAWPRPRAAGSTS
jgi:hypothetical protein